MEVKLQYQKGFKWQLISKEDRQVYYKGYFTSDKQLVNDVFGVGTFEDFTSNLSKLHGCFSIVILFQNETWAAVDNARSIPLFYSDDLSILADSAEVIREMLNISEDEVDLLLYAEMLTKRSASPGKTVYKEVRQVQAGEAININANEIKRTTYFSHFHRSVDNSQENLRQGFLKAAEKMIAGLKSTIGDKQIILPLSGGYDSRLIACLLKKHKYSNVVCYTYGRQADYEVKYSRMVAEKLDYEWHFVEYNREKWHRFFDDKDVRVYFENTHNHCNLPHVQEYIALKELCKQGIIQKGAIVIPGFCGDLPAGSFSNIPAFEKYSLRILAEYIYKEHYTNVKYNSALKKVLLDSLEEYFIEKKTEVHDQDSFIAAYEEWVTQNRVTMWVVNSVRVYEHFGLEWRLPMWDIDYLNFWYSVPNEFRKDCKLYRDCLFETIFSDFGVDYKKPKPSTTHDSKIKSVIANIIKGMLIFLSVWSGTDYYKRNNLNSYNEASISLLRRLMSKKHYRYHSLSVHLVEQIWWCQTKYGKANYGKVFSFKGH